MDEFDEEEEEEEFIAKSPAKGKRGGGAAIGNGSIQADIAQDVKAMISDCVEMLKEAESQASTIYSIVIFCQLKTCSSVFLSIILAATTVLKCRSCTAGTDVIQWRQREAADSRQLRHDTKAKGKGYIYNTVVVFASHIRYHQFISFIGNVAKPMGKAAGKKPGKGRGRKAAIDDDDEEEEGEFNSESNVLQ